MKKLYTIIAVVVLTASTFAQAPEKMSYQAVVRDASGQVVSDQTVGMQISILQDSETGTLVYAETQTPTTNANGLLSIEIGTGTSTDDFTAIDWTYPTYFVKTEIDPAGGTNYTITNSSQLISVPYALHANTAETISGGITETDPLLSENFDFTGAVDGDLLQFDADKSKWVTLKHDYISDYTVTLEDVTAHQAALTVTESQITNLGPYLEVETDPNLTTGSQFGEMQYWNGGTWITIAPTQYEGATLQMIGTVPKWVGGTIPSVTNPATGATWMDRNLGARRAATSSTDADAYGDLYQWGRATEGHQLRTSGRTGTGANTVIPNRGNSWDGLFIYKNNSWFGYDWVSPSYDNLWQGVNGYNNPCPEGYRIPTKAEWEAELATWTSPNAAGAFASPLKLPLAGWRYYSNGILGQDGERGRYWSSTANTSPSSYYLYFKSDGTAGMYSRYRTHGVSVRCIKD